MSQMELDMPSPVPQYVHAFPSASATTPAYNSTNAFFHTPSSIQTHNATWYAPYTPSPSSASRKRRQSGYDDEEPMTPVATSFSNKRVLKPVSSRSRFQPQQFTNIAAARPSWLTAPEHGLMLEAADMDVAYPTGKVQRIPHAELLESLSASTGCTVLVLCFWSGGWATSTALDGPELIFAMSKAHTAFRRLDARVFAVGTDSPWMHLRYLSTLPVNAVTLPILSDTTRTMTLSMAAMDPGCGTRCMDAIVLVDKNGRRRGLVPFLPGSRVEDVVEKAKEGVEWLNAE
ncbi:hypothetical protein SAICODRAFT_28562 [Saitoella complicata NRRL Y-17804]|nr:uncharacterized protein SAICODRAFT_28562 [Saitoella complicata NRRL Y-17804]ODQ56360.1 hypothetical protein SAICODRAFT_28562 [Saitoella complicata NRRL Y-17804]